MKNLSLLLVAGVLILLAVMIERYAPVPERPLICDDVCKAMEYIEAGWDVPNFIHFPIYMSRFDMEVVEIEDYYKSQLPKNICLGERAVVISDSTTGYKWLTDSYGSRYRIL